jgi:hypothetical protein
MSDPQALPSQDFTGVANIDEKMQGEMDFPCKPWKVIEGHFLSTHRGPALPSYAAVIPEECFPDKGLVEAPNLPFLTLVEEPA